MTESKANATVHRPSPTLNRNYSRAVRILVASLK